MFQLIRHRKREGLFELFEFRYKSLLITLEILDGRNAVLINGTGAVRCFIFAGDENNPLLLDLNGTVVTDSEYNDLKTVIEDIQSLRKEVRGKKLEDFVAEAAKKEGLL